MSIRLDIEKKYITSVKNKEESSIKTLRLIKSAIKNKDIATRTEDNKDGLSNDQIIILLQSLIKQRNESVEMYKKGGRTNLAESELKEIEIIKSFLPKQLDEKELTEIVKDIFKNNNFTSIKDMGKVMGILKSEHSGKIDMSLAGKIVKEYIK